MRRTLSTDTEASPSSVGWRIQRPSEMGKGYAGKDIFGVKKQSSLHQTEFRKTLSVLRLLRPFCKSLQSFDKSICIASKMTIPAHSTLWAFSGERGRGCGAPDCVTSDRRLFIAAYKFRLHEVYEDFFKNGRFSCSRKQRNNVALSIIHVVWAIMHTFFFRFCVINGWLQPRNATGCLTTGRADVVATLLSNPSITSSCISRVSRKLLQV